MISSLSGLTHRSQTMTYYLKVNGDQPSKRKKSSITIYRKRFVVFASCLSTHQVSDTVVRARFLATISHVQKGCISLALNFILYHTITIFQNHEYQIYEKKLYIKINISIIKISILLEF